MSARPSFPASLLFAIFLALPAGILAQPLAADRFGGLSPVSTPSSFPWSAVGRLTDRWPSGGFETCSGVMIDPRHFLTAGHCVYSKERPSPEYATDIKVSPGYQSGSVPYGSASGIAQPWLAPGFTTTPLPAGWQSDLAVIPLDRPIGAIAGWFQRGYHSDCAFFMTTTLNETGYPGETMLYNGQTMYNWSGTYDSCPDANEISHYPTAYNGQSGSPVWREVAGQGFFTYGVVSHRPDPPVEPNDQNQQQTNTRLSATTDAAIQSFIDSYRPTSPDLFALNGIGPGSVEAGRQLASLFFVLYNDSKTAFNGTLTCSIFLSTDRAINDSDIFLGSVSTSVSTVFPNAQGITLPAATLPFVPAGTQPGNYFLGIRLDYSGRSRGMFADDAAPIVVTAPASNAPAVTTNDASSISPNSATLNATVDPKGQSTTTGFDYGPSPNYGFSTGAQNLNGSGAQPISTTVANLNCGTLYYFRGRASNSGGITNGMQQTFTTGTCQLQGPTITNQHVTDITATSATLNADINPNGSDTFVNFSYDNATRSTAVIDIGSGSSAIPVAQGVSGLTCGTQYSYRAIASNGAGTFQGPLATFSTTACSSQPSGAEYAADADTVALLHLNEASGAALADASSAGNNGTATGSSVTPAVYGNGRRLANDVNGVASEFVSLGTASSLNPAALTFEAWIRPTSGSQGLVNGIPIVSREDSYAGNVAYLFEMVSGPAGTPCGGTNVLHVYDGDVSLCSAAGLSLQRWTHVAFTLTASGGMKTAQLFLNGQLAGRQTVAGSMHMNSLTTYVGRRWGSMGGSQYNRGFDGLIDEIRMSSRVRQAQELRVAAARGDHDGDANPDVYWRNYSTGVTAAWLMNGTSFSGTVVNFPTLTNVQYRIEGVADFNGDGQPDILWRNGTTGAAAIWIMNGVNVSAIVDLPTLVGSNFRFEGTADMDGDGDPDILIRNYANGANAVWIMNGNAFSGTVINLPTLTNLDYHIEGAADFDGNGTADILWRNHTNGATAIWIMNGTTFTGTVVNLPTLSNTQFHIDAVGDFDKDGKNDIVWRNYSTGVTAIWIMNGTTFSGKVINLPTLTDVNFELAGPR